MRIYLRSLVTVLLLVPLLASCAKRSEETQARADLVATPEPSGSPSVPAPAPAPPAEERTESAQLSGEPWPATDEPPARVEPEPQSVVAQAAPQKEPAVEPKPDTAAPAPSSAAPEPAATGGTLPKREPPKVAKLPAKLGTVTFDHAKHAETMKIACDTCHHASKPEKPLVAQQQACRECHTQPATPPVKTALRAAFHDVKAASGLCIDCHKKPENQAKVTIAKCADCHKKEAAAG